VNSYKRKRGQELRFYGLELEFLEVCLQKTGIRIRFINGYLDAEITEGTESGSGILLNGAGLRQILRSGMRRCR